jgi:hypothetical protein
MTTLLHRRGVQSSAAAALVSGISAEIAPWRGPVPVSLPPARVTRLLAAVATTLVGAHVLVIGATILLDRPSLYGLARLFDLNQEQNIPSFYSALLLLAAALCLAAVALRERAGRSRWWRHWAGLAAGFAYLSVDEAASIHEKFNQPVQQLLGHGADRSDWVYAAAVAVAAVGLLYARFLLALPRRLRLAFVAAGLLYVGSAVGVEHLAGHVRVLRLDGGYDWTGLLEVALEEGGEMTGVVLFIRAVLGHLRAAGATLLLDFGAVPEA